MKRLKQLILTFNLAVVSTLAIGQNIAISDDPYGNLTYPYESIQLPSNHNLRINFGTAERFLLKNNGDLQITGGGLFNKVAIGDDPYGSLPYAYESIQLESHRNLRVNFGNVERFIFTNSGRLGISIANPLTQLHVVDNNNSEVVRIQSSTASSQIKLSATGNGGKDWSIISTADGASLGGGKFSIYGNAQHRFVVDQTGNIGIGTTSPSAKLEVYGGGNVLIKGANNDAGDLIFQTNSSSQLGRIWTNSSGSSGLYLSSGDNNADIIINESGKVGIGTATTGSHKLAVEGSIGAREIKVEASGWSDFVFKNDYDLRTLEEVEQHISEKGHLPEIPSESEVTENGINLGEMDAKLLQKIEELTLYLIEEHKNNKILAEKMERLEEELSTLKNE